jgi:hypothetical protein
MTQNAFVLMLEQGLIQISQYLICALINLYSKLFVLSFLKGFLEEHICPLLVQLTDFSNLDDYRMEAVGVSQLTFN